MGSATRGPVAELRARDVRTRERVLRAPPDGALLEGSAAPWAAEPAVPVYVVVQVLSWLAAVDRA
jgi:hypothetical protein